MLGGGWRWECAVGGEGRCAVARGYSVFSVCGGGVCRRRMCVEVVSCIQCMWCRWLCVCLGVWGLCNVHMAQLCCVCIEIETGVCSEGTVSHHQAGKAPSIVFPCWGCLLELGPRLFAPSALMRPHFALCCEIWSHCQVLALIGRAEVSFLIEGRWDRPA